MTIKDIAKLAGTSVATVSRVINGDARVAQATKQSVLLVIEQTGFTPNFVGRNLRRAKSGKILVIVPTTTNPFFSKILRGIEQRALESDYTVLVGVSQLNNELERKFLDMLITKQVDGVISFFSTIDKQELSEIARKLPYVECCEFSGCANVSHTFVDNEAAACDAVNYLVSYGHKRIAMISGKYYRSSEGLRATGYKRALAEAGLEFDPHLVEYGNYTYDGAALCCEKLLAQKNPPTAFFTVSDSTAAGTIKCLLEHGYKVGSDVDVIGFDNASIATMFIPSITSVSQPRFELGSTSFDLLLEKIQEINAISKTIILPHSLVVRESTGNKPLRSV